MKHLEIISLRCFNPDIEELVNRYIAPMMNLEEVKQAFEVKVYRHSKLEMDIVLKIKRKDNLTSNRKSIIGLRLADNLKSFGIINHSIWKEMRF